MNDSPRDIPHILLQLLLLGGLLAGTFWIIRPFLGPLIWAATIVIATWPVVLRLRARFRGARKPPAFILVAALLLIFILPLSVAITTLVTNADVIVEKSKSLVKLVPPKPPEWVEGLPVVGPTIAARWSGIAAAGPQGWGERLAPYTARVARWLGGRVGGLGLIVVQFVLTTVMAGILWTNGDALAVWVIRCARRLGGEKGEGTVTLAAQAIRGVAVGVVVTALVQAVLGGIGLAIAGVPYIVPLIAVMLFLAVAQIGVWPVLVVATVWLYGTGHLGFAIFLLVWTIVVGTLDNFVRPVLIRRGADLPLLLVFAGVLGGLVAFGVIGLFVGPVILAVSFKLFVAWIEEGERVAGPGGARVGGKAIGP